VEQTVTTANANPGDHKGVVLGRDQKMVIVVRE
jgi:hypothetical protein